MEARSILLLIVMLNCPSGCLGKGCVLPNNSNSIAASKARDELGRLELKYFYHTYEFASDFARVERIERLIFGHVSTGDMRERISAIESAAESSETGKVINHTNVPSQAVIDPLVEAKVLNIPQKISKLEFDINGPTETTGTLTYRVSVLEQRQFHRVYTQDGLISRTLRLWNDFECSKEAFETDSVENISQRLSHALAGKGASSGFSTNNVSGSDTTSADTAFATPAPRSSLFRKIGHLAFAAITLIDGPADELGTYNNYGFSGW